jgi:hypothetical protein
MLRPLEHHLHHSALWSVRLERTSFRMYSVQFDTLTNYDQRQVAFANGAIYAQSARHIDQVVDDEFNLIALSFWLFVGDIGSVIGSNVLLYVCMLVEKLPWFSNQ